MDYYSKGLGVGLAAIEVAHDRAVLEMTAMVDVYNKLSYDERLSDPGGRLDDKRIKLQKVLDALYEAKVELEEYMKGEV